MKSTTARDENGDDDFTPGPGTKAAAAIAAGLVVVGALCTMLLIFGTIAVLAFKVFVWSVHLQL